jgi:hypothetical protein
MELLAIIKLFSVILGCVITILTGVLLIRHRQLIEYFKDSFSFIRDDYQADKEIQYGNILSEMARAIKYGFKALRKSSSQTSFYENKSNEINQILVLIGKLIIAIGILGIIIIIIGTFWMISESQVNVNLY